MAGMGNSAGLRRDFGALERRRMEAAVLLEQGVSQSEVARRLGVHRQSVIRWMRQLAQVLKRGPETVGYASGMWTTGRVRDLIEDQCGVRYHETHVWRILRRFGWSCQRPTGWALERHEESIRYWQRVRRPQI